MLLHEMQIQHPTAAMIGRAATAQDDIVGDGTTTNVLFIGELMRQAERYITEGVHPRVLVEGIELAKKETLAFLETQKVDKEMTKELLIDVARTSLNTKIHPNLSNSMTEVLAEAVLTIKKDDKIDLHMIEVMHMQHKLSTESRLIKGLVLDHGARNPNMPKQLKNCYILCLNVSLEYEKTEVNSGFFWNSAEQREKLISSERAFTDAKVQKILDLKRQVCGEDKTKSFVVINQKGIDPESLDLLSKEGVIGIRRAKRRNMERIPLACGGKCINSVEDLSEKDLGFAKDVYETSLGDDKYTFIEGVENPFSCTILIKGPNDYSIAQTKEAIRDGLRAIKNSIEDKCLIAGAGAFEVAASSFLNTLKPSGKVKLGVMCFAEALLIVPRTLATNSGYDAQDTLLKIQEAHEKNNEAFGFDVSNGEPLAANVSQVYDNYIVKR